MNRAVLQPKKVDPSSNQRTLAISRSTSRKQILGLIAEGRALLSLQITSRTALRAAEHRERQWIQFIIAIFRRMFDHDTYARNYVKFQARVVGPLSFEQEVAYFESRVRECLMQLESDFGQLHVFPDAVGAQESDERSGRSGINYPGTRRRSGVVGFAAALAITVVLAIYFAFPWVQRNLTTRSVEQQLQSINGTGWILLGDYDMAQYRWTSGPYFEVNRLAAEHARNFPWVGDTIQLRSRTRVAVSNWSKESSKKQLVPPSTTAGRVREEDFTPVTLRSGSIIRVADVHWGDANDHPAAVWVRIVARVP
jgi:hypothetical protein